MQLNTILVTNIAKTQLSKLNQNYPVISITDRYTPRPEIPNPKNKRDILYLVFSPGDHFETDEKNLLSLKQTFDIIEFVKQQFEKKVEKIYIQCGEGRIRSYTLANAIYRYLDEPFLKEGYNVQHCTKESAIKTGSIDRTTLHRFIDFTDELAEVLKKGEDVASYVDSKQNKSGEPQ